MEFILRKVKKKDNSEVNEAIGARYEVYNRSTAPEMVAALWKSLGNTNEMPRDLFGMLVADDYILALHTDCAHYIMTENGTTFDRIKP